MTIENKRFPGVDLAKVIAIFFVVVLHVSNCGFNLQYDGGSSQGEIGSLMFHSVVWIMHSISCSCIDLFVLATGFLCITSRCRYSRLAKLWVATVFWGLVMLCICNFVLGYQIPWKLYVHASMPILFGQYWFFTAYFMLFLFMPFLNQGIVNLPQKTYWHLMGAIGIFICGYSCFGAGDLFSMRDGFSFPWLCMVYLIGAYLRLYNSCKWRPVILFSLSGFLSLVGQFLLSIDNHLKLKIFPSLIYVSPIILGIAILIFLGCLNLKISDKTGRFLKAISATTFGIYLIHVQPFVWENVWQANLHKITIGSVGQLIVYVFGISIIVFASLACVEYVRLKLFAVIGVDRLVSKIDNVLKR